MAEGATVGVAMGAWGWEGAGAAVVAGCRPGRLRGPGSS